jgi:hypothetical protein
MAKKTFDCIAFKTEAQATLLAETEGMTPEERRAHFRHKAEQGPLGSWWKLVQSRGDVAAADISTRPRQPGSSLGA